MQKIIKTLIGLGFVGLSMLGQAEEFRQFEMQSPDGKMRPYVIYQPDVDGKRPLLVYLHGAIARPTISSDPLAAAKKSSIIKLAREGGYYVLFPYGQQGATWFDDVGTQMVIKQIDWAKQHLPIDEQKVFMSGFSDGASGTLYFASTQADKFAGFIALNGSLAVAAHLGASPVFLQNINNKPLYMVNTHSDVLYPAKMMQPTIEMIKSHQPQVQFEALAGNHDMSYLPSIQGKLTKFIDEHQDQVQYKISLEASELNKASFDWLSIVSFDFDKPAKAWHMPYGLKMVNDKASFGIVPDTSYQGVGIKVAGFAKNNQTAKIMGVQIGDVIIKMGDVVLNHPYASLTYLSGKKAGEPTELTVSRDDKTLLLKGRFADAYTYEVFENKKPSAKIQANFDKQRQTLDINTSKVASFAIDFEQLPITNRNDFVLTINDKAHKISASGKQIFTVQ